MTTPLRRRTGIPATAIDFHPEFGHDHSNFKDYGVGAWRSADPCGCPAGAAAGRRPAGRAGRAGRVLRAPSTVFDNVGYGFMASFGQGPPAYGNPPGRMYSTSLFQALTPAYLKLLMNSDAQEGNGGICFGDSGSPKPIHQTNTVPPRNRRRRRLPGPDSPQPGARHRRRARVPRPAPRAALTQKEKTMTNQHVAASERAHTRRTVMIKGTAVVAVIGAGLFASARRWARREGVSAETALGSAGLPQVRQQSSPTTPRSSWRPKAMSSDRRRARRDVRLAEPQTVTTSTSPAGRHHPLSRRGVQRPAPCTAPGRRSRRTPARCTWRETRGTEGPVLFATYLTRRTSPPAPGSDRRGATRSPTARTSG